jgi:monoamine oxidase
MLAAMTIEAGAHRWLVVGAWMVAAGAGGAGPGCGGGRATPATRWPGPVGAPVDCTTLTGYDDIVIGAGLAGLAAARELQRFDRKVVILEATDHVGGRGFTYLVGSGDDRVGLDLGGAWVHGVETNPLTAIVDSLGFHRVRSNLDEPYYRGGARAADADLEAWGREDEAFGERLVAAGAKVRAGETPEAFCEAALGNDEAATLAFCNGVRDRTGAPPTAEDCGAALWLYCSEPVQAGLADVVADPSPEACPAAWATVKADVAAGLDAQQGELAAWLAPDRWQAVGAVACDFLAGRARDRASYYLPLTGPLRAFMEENLGPLDSAGPLHDTSAVDIGEFSEGEDDLVVEGMGTFVRRYGAHAPVCLNSPVTRISHDASGVTVDVAGGRSYRGQTALVTVSTGVLSHRDSEGAFSLAFSPPLSEAKRAALASLPMGAMQKVILRFKTDVFGAVHPNAWVLYQDDVTGAIMAFVIKPFGKPIAIGFFGGDQARAFEAACAGEGFDPEHPEARPSDAPAVAETKRAVARMYGIADVDAALAGPVVVTRWTQHPWTRGSYAVVLPGMVGAREVLAEPVPGGDGDGAVNRLYFAGEGVTRSIYSGSFAGSYETGLRAARRIVADRAAP